MSPDIEFDVDRCGDRRQEETALIELLVEERARKRLEADRPSERDAMTAANHRQGSRQLKGLIFDSLAPAGSFRACRAIFGRRTPPCWAMVGRLRHTLNLLT